MLEELEVLVEPLDEGVKWALGLTLDLARKMVLEWALESVFQWW